MDTKLKEYLDGIISDGLEKNYWFMTKQTMTDFYFFLTIAKIVETYNSNKLSTENFGLYYQRFFSEDSYLKKTYQKQTESENTYRNAIISEYLGLFRREKTGYDSAVVTPAYKVISRYIKTHEDLDQYRFLFERQIEKLCLNVNDKIQNYEELKDVKIFPVMFLYKILYELQTRIGNSTLYFDEFVVFLVRAKKYSDWEQTVKLILEYRENGLNDEYNQKYNKILNDVTASNIRFDALFGKLSNIEYAKLRDRNYYKIRNNYESLRYIENAIEIYENSKYSKDVTPNEMLEFLQSDKYFIGNIDVAFSRGNLIEEIFDKVDLYSPEWFKEKGQEFIDDGVEADILYSNFNDEYGYDALKVLQGEELLKKLFLGGDSKNLSHELEYVRRNQELFGSIKGGSAYKYPLFFDKNSQTWTTGTRHNPQQLSLDEAIIKGTAVRDGLLKGIQTIQSLMPFTTIDDYLNLYSKLYALIPDLVDSIWVTKYYHMIFPNIIPPFYNREWQEKVIKVINVKPNDAAYGRLGQINNFIEKCEISSVVFSQVFHKYCRDLLLEEEDKEEVIDDEIERLKGGTNIILYGVPGAGKSWTIKNEYCDDESQMERLVFHPDYTYSDFVGQILPRVSEDESVSYEFTPGPFTKLLRKAYKNANKMYYLIIEEINRGNAPAIFGDIFQLLDRTTDGNSEYAITNGDIAKIVYGDGNHKVSIPSNMSILCTMNTSDQNVFTLDTAFQRRWSMRLIQNKFRGEQELEFAETKILDTSVTWNKFFTEINKIILSKNIRMTSSEDKRLGTHFVAKADLMFSDNDTKQNSKFPEKVLKYLWDDAFKFTKEDIFDLDKVKSLEDVIDYFINEKGDERFRIFKDNIYNTLVARQQ